MRNVQMSVEFLDRLSTWLYRFPTASGCLFVQYRPRALRSYEFLKEHLSKMLSINKNHKNYVFSLNVFSIFFIFGPLAEKRAESSESQPDELQFDLPSFFFAFVTSALARFEICRGLSTFHKTKMSGPRAVLGWFSTRLNSPWSRFGWFSEHLRI